MTEPIYSLIAAKAKAEDARDQTIDPCLRALAMSLVNLSEGLIQIEQRNVPLHGGRMFPSPEESRKAIMVDRED